MAGTKRHIDQVLKNKLGNHQSPITESDWDAFDVFQQKRKPNRKPLFYWGAAVLLMGLLSALLLWNSSPSSESTQGLNDSPSTENTSTVSTEQGGTGTESTDAGEEVINSTKEVQANSGSESINSPTNTPAESVPQRSPEPKQKVKGEKPDLVEGNTPSTNPSAPSNQNPILDQAQVERFAPLHIPSISPKVLLIPTPTWGWFEQAYITAYEPKDQKDSNSVLSLKKFTKNLLPMGPCVAVGFVYGFGTPQLTVPASNPTEVHKDYEGAEKGSKAKTNVFRFFGQYEHRLNLGLEFSAGLQFSSVTQVRSYSFENRNIPVIGIDNEIIGYIHIPPSQSVDPTVFNSRQNIYSASVPMTIGYAHTLGNKLRIGVRAQGSLGMNWSKSYSTLNPKTLTEMNSAGNSNPFNMTYGGGVYGEYFYLSKWSLRGSLDWTAQNKQYNSKNSYNLQNRFYELRFSLVRYL